MTRTTPVIGMEDRIKEVLTYAFGSSISIRSSITVKEAERFTLVFGRCSVRAPVFPVNDPVFAVLHQYICLLEIVVAYSSRMRLTQQFEYLGPVGYIMKKESNKSDVGRTFHRRGGNEGSPAASWSQTAQ